MPSRIVITLDAHERTALGKIAEAELRDPRSQIRHILRQEMKRRGLMEKDSAKGDLDKQPSGQMIQSAGSP